MAEYVDIIGIQCNFIEAMFSNLKQKKTSIFDRNFARKLGQSLSAVEEC